MMGPEVAEVRRFCEESLAEGPRIILDVENVSFADREGVALFQDLINRQVVLGNCSPFLAWQIGLDPNEASSC